MAISIAWATKIITIPQSYLTDLGGGVYELDTDQFRLDLKDLEDSEEGMPFPTTHNHNTTVTVGGVTLARVIEIINGYTITFEDGMYAVKLTGSNNNISDVSNVNSVSIRSANSAGLIQISSGSGLSVDEQNMLLKVYQALALDPLNPVRQQRFSSTVSKIEFDDVVINLIGDEESDVLSTREP